MRHFYTAEDVKKEPVPKDKNCTITDLKSSGSKVSWKVECRVEVAGKGEGQISYQGDAAVDLAVELL
jgi:hypothetical protein